MTLPWRVTFVIHWSYSSLGFPSGKERERDEGMAPKEVFPSFNGYVFSFI